MDYAGRHVEDMREQYSIDELDLQNGMQQKKIWKLVFITILCLVVLLFVGLLYLRRAERKLLFSREELQKAKRLAEGSVRNKSVCLSNMSHEIKTPLNALAGFSEILITPGIDDEVRAQCNDVIRLNSDLLLHLVNDVVDVSCLDVANMRFSVAPHEVVALCRNVVEMLRNIKQTSAEMIFETELSALEMETDPCRLQQVLINLLVNATKFTKEGYITLTLRINEVGVPEFMLTDTGCGIPLENQEAVFGRFEKLNEGIQGTGLGLSICKLIINRMGGDIRVDSTYSKGARFIFTHPLKQEENR